MEPMTWFETIQLLGLDVQAALMLALFGFDAIERALHSAGKAWAERSQRTEPPRRIAVGWASHIT